jgi:hypothetical protein
MSRVTRTTGTDRRGSSAAELTDIGPGSTVTGLDEHELAVLRRVGGHWGGALGPRPAWLRALPIDPGLHRFPGTLPPRRADRFAPVDFIETGDPAEVVATAHAGAGTFFTSSSSSGSRPAASTARCRATMACAPAGKTLAQSIRAGSAIMFATPPAQTMR